MCLTHTILDDPDISKPSSSGSSLTEMIVSLPTPPYRTGVLQNVLLHCMPHNTSIASDAPKRKNTYPVGSMRADGSSRALRSTARVGVEAQPRAVVDLPARRRRVPVQVVFHAGGARWHSRVSTDARGGEEQEGGARHATDFGRGGFLTR